MSLRTGVALLISLLIPCTAALAEEDLILKMPPTLYLQSLDTPQIPKLLPPNSSLVNPPAAIQLLKSLIIPPAEVFKQTFKEKGVVAACEELLNSNRQTFGLAGSAGTIELQSLRETATGQVVEFHQIVNGIAVDASIVGLVVTSQGDVRSLSTQLIKIPNSKVGSISKAPSLSIQSAEDIAWKDMGSVGKLLKSPDVKLVYIPENNALTLGYTVDISTVSPLAYWRYWIDGTTGRLIQRQKRSVDENHGKRRIDGPTSSPDRLIHQSLEDAEKIVLAKVTAGQMTVIYDGTTQLVVFRPDPVTALNDETLRDDSPAHAFDSAYVNVSVSGLRRDGQKIFLQSADVIISDFEQGEKSSGGSEEADPPSTTSAGWLAHRGDSGFNDAMTFYYLTQSLNYFRSLGYIGKLEKFQKPILADSDGLEGCDNSHYLPDLDRLAFGHGGVDDNEDADVIFHEFGHAITYHLDPSWGGGDSAAIGEGFGDYWAATYHIRQPNGTIVDEAKVFKWDGCNACWGGRRMDRTNAKYNSGMTYDAHEPMTGFQSDELWSTPLFQSLLELLRDGETSESVDRVVLAGMENVTSGFTMRQLAEATVFAASTLFPGKEHAAVFKKHFQDAGIIP